MTHTTHFCFSSARRREIEGGANVNPMPNIIASPADEKQKSIVRGVFYRQATPPGFGEQASRALVLIPLHPIVQNQRTEDGFTLLGISIAT